MIDYQALNEAEVARVERETYEGQMPSHNKEVLRRKLEAEDLFHLKEATREDSHSPVGDWWGAREVSD